MGTALLCLLWWLCGFVSTVAFHIGAAHYQNVTPPRINEPLLTVGDLIDCVWFGIFGPIMLVTALFVAALVLLQRVDVACRWSWMRDWERFKSKVLIPARCDGSRGASREVDWGKPAGREVW